MFDRIQSSTWRPFALAVAFAVAASAFGCGGAEEEASAGPAGGPRGPGGPGGERPAVPVAVELAAVGPASSYYTTTASLDAASRAEIQARTTGVVRRILHEEGDVVSAGEALLLLEDEEARLRVQQAIANHRLAQADYERRRAMLDGGLLSNEEFEATESTLQVRESELGLARVALSYTQVVAPFAGRVVRRYVDLGASISPGVALFEMMDVTPLLARVHIPAKRMGFVNVGQDMEVRLDGKDTALRGVVSLVSPIVDAATGTVKVTAEIAEYPQGTRPGDFAEVRIVTARHTDAILVPSRALFEEQGEDVLYVVEESKAARRVVDTGFVDGDLTEIREGVEAGALVVVKGQRQLRDGGSVEILEGPPEVLANLPQTAEPEAPEDGAKGRGDGKKRKGRRDDT